MMKKIIAIVMLWLSLAAHADPSLQITAGTQLLAKGGTTTVTFTWSESVTGFDATDIAVAPSAGGAISAFNGSGTTYTATFTKNSTGQTSITVDNNVATPTGTGMSLGFNTPVYYIDGSGADAGKKVVAVPQPVCPVIGEKLINPTNRAVENFYVLRPKGNVYVFSRIQQGCLTRLVAGQSFVKDTAAPAYIQAIPNGVHNHAANMPKVRLPEGFKRMTGTREILIRPANHDCNRQVFHDTPGSAGGHCVGNGGQQRFLFTTSAGNMQNDDPIIFPNQKGVSHLHGFYGNVNVDYTTTNASLLRTCEATAPGGIVNCTGYWTPQMIDTATQTAINPKSIQVYYKSVNDFLNEVEPFAVTEKIPQGLKIIGGNPSANSQATAGRTGNYCLGRNGGALQSTQPYQIPDCEGKDYDTVRMVVEMPACVQDNGSGGMVLDSTNHKDHTAYFATAAPFAANGVCPASHPHLLPIISVIVDYPLGFSQNSRTFRLSSDNYSSTLPGGYSYHADWWGMWRNTAPYDAADKLQKVNNSYFDAGEKYMGLSDGVTISAISVSGTTATITTATPHHLPADPFWFPPSNNHWDGTRSHLLGRITGVGGASAAIYNSDLSSANYLVNNIRNGAYNATHSLLPVGDKVLTIIDATHVSYQLSSAPADTNPPVTGAKLQWGEELCQLHDDCSPDYYKFYYPIP
ncbi:MAG: DUF1996 domain-containing protein [Methylophilus sp.]